MKCQSGPLMKILVPLPLEGEELQHIPITDGNIIEDVLLLRNKLNFNQASDTPLAINEIIQEIGFSGSTKITKKF